MANKILEKIKSKQELRKQRKQEKRQTLEAKREAVLARGNKFRYPLQFSKHKVMIVTVVISVVTMAAMAGGLFWILYHGNNTGDMIYKIVKVLPLPVADVDGEKVRYGDYLLVYRGSIAPVEKQTDQLSKNNKDADAIKLHYKRSALSGVEDMTYALKIAREKGILVTSEELNNYWEKQKNMGGVERSENSFLQVVRSNFGLNKSEYLRMAELNIVKMKVMQAVDEEATNVAKEVEERIAKGEDFKKIMEEMKEKVIYEETGGMVDAQNVDGGRAERAMQLEKDKVSEKFLANNGEGFYFVKTLDKNEKQVHYASIRVTFREFDKMMRKLREEGKIAEFIKL